MVTRLAYKVFQCMQTDEALLFTVPSIRRIGSFSYRTEVNKKQGSAKCRALHIGAGQNRRLSDSICKRLLGQLNLARLQSLTVIFLSLPDKLQIIPFLRRDIRLAGRTLAQVEFIH